MYCITQHPYDALNDIYHSTSMHEMKVKADLHSIDLNDIDAIMFLVDQTTYHHAFWPHTAKRFVAFKNLLRTMVNLPANPDFQRLVDSVKTSIDERENNRWIRSTPGGKQEIKNLKQVLKILKNLENNSNE